MAPSPAGQDPGGAKTGPSLGTTTVTLSSPQKSICGRPRFARKFEFWWIGSFASICPASHGGRGVKLLHVTIPPFLAYNAWAGVTQRGAPINACSPAKPHIRRNLRSHHGPAFGTGELKKAAPLFETAHVHQAGQRRRLLGSIY